MSDSLQKLPRVKSHIEINGCSDLLIEGCAGVLEYGEDTIRMSLGQQVLIVRGMGLEILNMYGETVTIGGKISTVEFM